MSSKTNISDNNDGLSTENGSNLLTQAEATENKEVSSTENGSNVLTQKEATENNDSLSTENGSNVLTQTEGTENNEGSSTENGSTGLTEKGVRDNSASIIPDVLSYKNEHLSINVKKEDSWLDGNWDRTIDYLGLKDESMVDSVKGWSQEQFRKVLDTGKPLKDYLYPSFHIENLYMSTSTRTRMQQKWFCHQEKADSSLLSHKTRRQNLLLRTKQKGIS